MHLFRLTVLACLAACYAASAYAQYGLYGSPETLRLPATTAVPADVSIDPAGSSMTAPAAQPVPPAQAIYQPYRPSQPTQGAQPAFAASAYGQTPSPATPLQPVPAGAGQTPSAAKPAATPQGSYAGDVYRGGSNGNCGALCGNACCTDNDCCLWYGSLSALVLGRSEGRRLWTSYVSDHNVDQLTNTQDIHLPWAWGGEVQIGRRFCGCCCEPWAIEGTFWTTQPMSGYSSTINSTIAPFTVSTPLQVSDLTFHGEIAPDWFNGAEEHRLWRRDEFYNLEINLVRMHTPCNCASPWEAGWLAGFRYFRFDENLTFGSLRNGATWGELGNEAYLSDQISNDLWGFQVGFDLAYRFADRARFFITPKIGIYDNCMNTHFQAYLGDGTVGSTPYGDFPVRSNRNDIAFLSQIDLGVEWQFSRNWSAQVGYRVIAATGIAEADDQFPQYIVDVPEIQHIDNHSSLVLHGAFMGVTYCF